MSLITWRANEAWNPFEELLRFSDSRAWAPAIDVVETKESLRVQAEIPGLNKEDMRVSVRSNTLIIEGEKKQEKDVREGGSVRTERTYGSFYRSFTLPENVEASSAKANYKNGVLELVFPKKKDTEAKQIDVEVK